MKKTFLLFLSFFPLCTFAQTAANDSLQTITATAVPRLKPFHFITNVPDDMLQLTKAPFHRKNLKGLVIVAGATAVLLPFDQAITDGVKHLGRQINLDPETDYRVPIKIGTTKILKVPHNITSALYQWGEGGTSMMLAGGLFVYGKIKHDRLALGTASDLTETFITMGVTTQLIKRISGRQSPFMSSDEGGFWKPFPSFHDFETNTSNYDAFPSGHLATMMATVTTLALNYPGKKWIKPVGYAAMSLTGLAMINTDVHWISDYPLALALGYVSAKITYRKNHPHRRTVMITENVL